MNEGSVVYTCRHMLPGILVAYTGLLQCMVLNELVNEVVNELLCSCPSRKRRKDSDADYQAPAAKGASLLSTEMEELSGIYYRPRTKETKSTYEVLLSFILQHIGDQVCACVQMHCTHVHVHCRTLYVYVHA